MATLNELRTIYTNATAFVDPGTPTQAEIDAHALLDRCEAQLWRLASGIYAVDDTTADLRNLKTANRVTVESRDLARRMLIILLGSTTAESATAAQILSSNDTAIATAINAVAGRFALVLTQPSAK